MQIVVAVSNLNQTTHINFFPSLFEIVLENNSDLKIQSSNERPESNYVVVVVFDWLGFKSKLSRVTRTV